LSSTAFQLTQAPQKVGNAQCESPQCTYMPTLIAQLSLYPHTHLFWSMLVLHGCTIDASSAKSPLRCCWQWGHCGPGTVVGFDGLKGRCASACENPATKTSTQTQLHTNTPTTHTYRPKDRETERQRGQRDRETDKHRHKRTD
jgi:hypothetical protein